MLLGGGAVVATIGGAAAVTSGALRGLTGGSTGSDDGDSGGTNDDETGSGTTDSGDDTVIAVGSARIGSGETGTVPVTLDSAPDGMAGFKLTVEVDTAVAAIADATVDEKFGLSSVTVAEDGSAATLEAAERIDPGATDVELGTVTAEGVGAGSTALELTVELFDDADGDVHSPETVDGEITVE